jgi:D-alanyl-D-alanine carboxypeptidase/D-alanyl-D-alanine-endopeptidase (penicillin-binding protein 4)
LRAALRTHHISVDGATRYERSSGGTILWQHDSPPLSALVHTMLTQSDNQIAEQLLRATGRGTSGVGSEAAGVAAVFRYLDALRVPTAGLQMDDGSGLAESDRATPRTLATLLWRLNGTLEGDQIHNALLPVTSANDPIAEPHDRILAKSGRVGASRNLAGVVDRAPKRPLSFAILDTVEQPGDSVALRNDEADVLQRLALLTP